MWLVWLLIGIVIGAVVVWTIIKRKIDEQAAATEARHEGQLRHLQAEVGRADQAHEETKTKLHELLADRNAEKERADRVGEEAVAARRSATSADARATRLEAELAECRQRGQELDARLVQTKTLVDELEARIREMPAQPAAPQSDTAPPPGPAAGTVENAERLKAIEARLATVPPGTTTHTALTQERAGLLRAVGGDLPIPGVPGETPAPPTLPRPAPDARSQRIKAIDAKLKMLPAGSSARAMLLAERTRLIDGPAVELPTAPPDKAPDDLEVIKGIGPVINGELVAMGIVTFAQLVALTPAQIEYLEDKIGFPGRVAREHWIEQARDLMAGGTPPA